MNYELTRMFVESCNEIFKYIDINSTEPRFRAFYDDGIFDEAGKTCKCDHEGALRCVRAISNDLNMKFTIPLVCNEVEAVLDDVEETNQLQKRFDVWLHLLKRLASYPTINNINPDVEVEGTQTYNQRMLAITYYEKIHSDRRLLKTYLIRIAERYGLNVPDWVNDIDNPEGYKAQPQPPTQNNTRLDFPYIDVTDTDKCRKIADTIKYCAEKRKGKDVAFILRAANNLEWIKMPNYKQATNLLGKGIGNKSGYNRYKNIECYDNEIKGFEKQLSNYYEKLLNR